MAMHHKLPINKTGSSLLAHATTILVKMDRQYKRAVGENFVTHCSKMLDLMALANATRGPQRVQHLQDLLTHQRAATTWLRVAMELKVVAPAHWATAVQMLESISKQATRWAATTRQPAPAA